MCIREGEDVTELSANRLRDYWEAWIKQGRIPSLTRRLRIRRSCHRRPKNLEGHQIAFSPTSSVRMRTASSIVETNILPSPTAPVFAALIIALTADSSSTSATTAKTRILGTKSTVYSLP